MRRRRRTDRVAPPYKAARRARTRSPRTSHPRASPAGAPRLLRVGCMPADTRARRRAKRSRLHADEPIVLLAAADDEHGLGHQIRERELAIDVGDLDVVD